MEKQNYKNHIRFYVPHHFIFYPLVMGLLIISIYEIFNSSDKLIWFFISLVFAVFIFLSFMLRQHYSLVLQNRIAKLELRYRYFTLSGKRFELIEDKLEDSQLFALRFASDDQFLDLVEKTIEHRLSGDAIKKSIINWKGDYERV